jgi:hypothetical protein
MTQFKQLFYKCRGEMYLWKEFNRLAVTKEVLTGQRVTMYVHEVFFIYDSRSYAFPH